MSLMTVVAVGVLRAMDDVVFYAYPFAVNILFSFGFLGFLLGCGIFRTFAYRSFLFSVCAVVNFVFVCPTRLA